MNEPGIGQSAEERDGRGSDSTRRWTGLLVGAILVLAFFFRSFGLSHDLDLGKNYHPDTPKQVRMTERFTRGIFYQELGNRNYDGYPYFNSLIAAGVYQVTVAAADAWRNHLGLKTADPMPAIILMDWITRFMNVLISTLTVWVLFFIGRRMGGTRVALWSALMLALSPLDIAACHYSSGDSTAGFFAALSLLFSVRIYQRGRAWDYILSAAACMCAFSAKYQGALVAPALIVAHVMRARSLRELMGAASFRMAGLVLLTVVAVFFLTNPGTLVQTSRAITKIVEFLQFSSQFGQRDEAIRAMSPFTRWVNSLQMNLPVFAQCMSPVFLLLAGLGVGWSFTRPRAWLIVSITPVLYVLVGLSAKTAENAVYGTIVTPPLFLLAALVVGKIMAIEPWRPMSRWIAWASLVVGFLLLANAAYQESFFFWNNDTRILSERWVKENVPEHFRVVGGRYTDLDPNLSERSGPFTGEVFVRADIRDRVPTGFFRMNGFSMEEQPLPLFRNFPTEIYVAGDRGIRANWQLPVFQPIATSFDTDLIFAGSREFWKTPRQFQVTEDRPVNKTIVSPDRLDGVLAVVVAGHVPTRVSVSIGDQDAKWFLNSDETAWSVFKGMRRRLPLIAGFYGYRVLAASSAGPAQVILAFTPEEKGMAWVQLGAYREALPWLEQAAAEGSPTAAAWRQIAAAILAPDEEVPPRRPFSALAAYVSRPMVAADLNLLYGVSAGYLQDLAPLDWDASRLSGEGFRFAGARAGSLPRWAQECDEPQEGPGVLVAEATSNATRQVVGPLTMLPSGCYGLRLYCSLGAPIERPTRIDVTLSDAAGRLVGRPEFLTLDPGRFGTVEMLECSVQKPARPMAVRVVLEMTNSINLVIHRAQLRPDWLAGVVALNRALGSLVYNEPLRAAAVPANYDALMAMADSLAATDRPGRSRPYYLAAAQACTNRVDPVEGLIRSSQQIRRDLPEEMVSRVSEYAAVAASSREQPVEVRFSGGVRLTGFSMTSKQVRPGETLGLRLQWDVGHADSRRSRTAVWVHVLDADGRIAFQGDHALQADLALPSGVRTLGMGKYWPMPVPESLKPGTYKVRVGLWVPYQRLRLTAESDAIPIVKRGAELATVEILPPRGHAGATAN